MNCLIPVTDGRDKIKGFTLIELLVTLAVIAVLLGVGVPIFGSLSRDSTVTGATSELVATLNDARSRAAAEGTQMRVESLSNDAFWSQGWRTVRVSDDEVQVSMPRSDGDLLVINETGGQAAIVFDTEGRAVAPASFHVEPSVMQTGSAIRDINVNRFGRTEVVKSVAP